MAASITVSNDDFVKLLAAAKITARLHRTEEDPGCAGMHLATMRIDGDEAGTDTVLVATTTDRLVVGQLTVPVDGELSTPILFPLSDKWIENMITGAKREMKRIAGSKADFAVRLTPTETSVRIETLTDGGQGARDDSATRSLLPAEQFPLATAIADLHGRPNATIRDAEGEEIPAESKAQGYGEQQLRVMLAAAKVFGTVVEYTPKHHASIRVLTAGTWRAVVPGALIAATADTEEPEVPVMDMRAALGLSTSNDPREAAESDSARADAGAKARADAALAIELAAVAQAE